MYVIWIVLIRLIVKNLPQKGQKGIFKLSKAEARGDKRGEEVDTLRTLYFCTAHVNGGPGTYNADIRV